MDDSIIGNPEAFRDYQEACKHLANTTFEEMGDDTFFDYFPAATAFVHFYFHHVLIKTPYNPDKLELYYYDFDQAQELIPHDLVKRMLTRIVELTPPVMIQHFNIEIDHQDREDYADWGIPLDRVILAKS